MSENEKKEKAVILEGTETKTETTKKGKKMEKTEKKAEKKNASAKGVTKKTMKREPEKKVLKRASTEVDHSIVEKMFNKLLADKELKKGLVVSRNARGAVQIRRDGALLISTRADGVIITHPMYEGKGKTKSRIFPCTDKGFFNLSRVPREKVTYDMLVARVKDPKSVHEYHKEFYSGEKASESGLLMKRTAAAKRVGKEPEPITEVKKGKKKKAKEADAIKMEAKTRKAKASKPKRTPVATAIAAVATETGTKD